MVGQNMLDITKFISKAPITLAFSASVIAFQYKLSMCKWLFAIRSNTTILILLNQYCYVKITVL